MAARRTIQTGVMAFDSRRPEDAVADLRKLAGQATWYL